MRLLLLFLANGSLLIGLAVVGRKIRGIFGAFLVLQSIYWSVSWLLRPLILVYVHPAPRFGDSIADRRLALYGYTLMLEKMLPLVTIGLAVTLGVTWLCSKTDLARVPGPPRPVTPQLAIAFIVVVGWAGRLLGGTHAPSGVLPTVGILASVGVGCHILLSDRSADHWLPVTVVLLCAEAAWSFVAETKAPILAAFVWLLISQLQGRAPAKRLAMSGLLVLVAFIGIQEAKVASGILSSNTHIEQSYPAPIRPSLFFVRRFDFVSALTDAYLAGPGRWISRGEAMKEFSVSLLPRQVVGDKGDQAGAQWAESVRGLSVQNSDTGVHLAEGPVAEGYVLDGVRGVLFESALMALATFGVCIALARGNLFLQLFGLAMMTQPYLFERGLLGLGEGLGKSWQVALVGCGLVIVARVVSGYEGPRSRPSTVPSLMQSGT